MKWQEFKALVACFDVKTPLGRIVQIRAEDQPERLRQFTPQMHEIRNKWRRRKAEQMPQKNVDAFLAEMQKTFKLMAGGDVRDEKDQMPGLP